MEQDQVRGQSEVSETDSGNALSRTTRETETSGTKDSGRVQARENDNPKSPTSNQSEDFTLSDTNKSLEEAAKSIKRPIFIATAEGNIAMEVENILFEKKKIYSQGFDVEDDDDPFLSKDEYVLLVVNPEIYNGLRQQYLFSLLKEDEQTRVSQIAINEELHQKALTQALQIEEFIKNWNDARNCIVGSGEEIQIVFNETELRVILNKMKHLTGEKARLTHQDTWNIMDLLVLQGFLLVDNVLEEIHRREKRKYRLVIKDGDKLNHIKTQRDQSLYLQRKYKDQEDSLNNQITELELKIQKEQQDVKSESETSGMALANPSGNLNPSL